MRDLLGKKKKYLCMCGPKKKKKSYEMVSWDFFIRVCMGSMNYDLWKVGLMRYLKVCIGWLEGFFNLTCHMCRNQPNSHE